MHAGRPFSGMRARGPHSLRCVALRAHRLGRALWKTRDPAAVGSTGDAHRRGFGVLQVVIPKRSESQPHCIHVGSGCSPDRELRAGNPRNKQQ